MVSRKRRIEIQSLVLDDNAIQVADSFGRDVLLNTSIVGSATLETAEQHRPPRDAFIMGDAKMRQTGWQQVRIPVGPFAGSPAMLALRLQTFLPPLAPTYCFPGVPLLDKLRFE